MTVSTLKERSNKSKNMIGDIQFLFSKLGESFSKPKGIIYRDHWIHRCFNLFYFIFQKGIIGNAMTYLLKQHSHNQFHNQVLVTSVDSTSLMELQCDCIKKGTGATGYGHGWK